MRGHHDRTMIDIRVEPITADTRSPQGDEGSVLAQGDGTRYWALFVDDRYVSHVSSRELAESGKKWLEKWFEDLN